jgi:integrase
MTPNDIVDGKISYVSQKTKKLTHVESKKGLNSLIETGNKWSYCDSVFNDTIRDIARKSGINSHVRVFKAGKYNDGEKWQFISSHTARRSFATNLCLLGVPIRDISLRMGHSNTLMTERYIVAQQSNLSNKALAFFK